MHEHLDCAPTAKHVHPSSSRTLRIAMVDSFRPLLDEDAQGRTLCQVPVYKNRCLTICQVAAYKEVMVRPGRPGRADTPLARHLRARGMTYREAIEALHEAGTSITMTWFGNIVRGQSRPSVRLAEEIGRALGLQTKDVLGLP